ncbi:MAG: glycoside hydrolase family 16 protein, partial [Oscillospiraceae bacterium]|nr:glycoside hydrolase family 16 protein [Oscillospiraceae bacterium]
DIWHPCYMHEGKPGGPVDAAHSFRDGSLVLRIDRDSEMWRDSDGLYVSGIHTNGKFAQQYGYFEIRAKSQTGGGIHTAFWTMNAEGTPYEEIDIFEQLGRSPATNHHALHLDAGKGDGSLDSTGKEARMGFDTTGGFHIYALEWDESSVKYYADNMLVHQIDKAPQHNAYIILSMYMSEDPTYWTAPYNPDVPFPKEFVIDYFRAYKKA